MRVSILFAATLVAAFFCGAAAGQGVAGAEAPAPAAPSPAIAAAVDDAFERYRLPGLAVGVVVGGEVRQVELRGEVVAGAAPLSRDTLFKVASNTKAMTAALLARQVDAGLLAWDDPVVKHLPGFRMHEDWVTREIQVRDLLIHNSGLGPGAGDLMLWPEPNSFTRDEVIAGLAHLKPLWSFRSRYAYDNTLYIVAGEVAAAAGGAPFDELLRREVFEPLGMHGCRIGEWRVDEAGSVAAPHVRGDDGWIARPDGEVVADMPMAAAGGVRCGLDDMLRWVEAWLDPDTLGADGRPWLSTAQREAAWTAHMPMPLTGRMRDWNRSHYYAYGLGWRLSDVDGTAKVAHTGTLSGMYSAVTLLPELDAGFVILINGSAGEARTVLEQTLSKHFTAPAEGRTVAYYAEALAAERAVAGAIAAMAAPTKAAPTKAAPAEAGPAEAAPAEAGPAEAAPAEAVPPVGAATAAMASPRAPAAADSLAPWLGHYRDPWFGEITVCPAGAGAGASAGVRFESAKSPRLSGPVLRAGDRLLVDFDTLGADADAWLDFSPGQAGGPPRLAMAKVDPEADFSYDYEDLAFVRIGDCR